ncbi:dihydrolipoamide acetyltransferase family protein [Gemmatimonadota bacterium]
MARPLLMPQVGQDIETAVIVRWLVREGDSLKTGQIFVEVESEKAAFEVEAEESGTVLKLLYEEGEEARVLEPIAYVGEPGEKLGDTEASEADATRDGLKTVEKKVAVEEEEERSGETKVFAAPAARRLAREHSIDLSAIKGSGPKGRIVKNDVLAAVSSAGSPKTAELEALKVKHPAVQDVKKAPGEDREIPFSRMRKKIAERLTLSKQTIPHFYLFIDVEMSAALAWRVEFNSESQAEVTINDIIVKAAASALAEYRDINAHVAEGSHILRKNINIGVAVSTEEGLLVPVIHDADRKDILEISQVSGENANAARKGILKAGSAGTFTISNLGMFGISSFLPIINPPECAILGVGGIEKKAVPLDDSNIGVRDIMTLTLACDHRVVDGAYAAAFLKIIKRKLEETDL